MSKKFLFVTKIIVIFVSLILTNSVLAASLSLWDESIQGDAPFGGPNAVYLGTPAQGEYIKGSCDYATGSDSCLDLYRFFYDQSYDFISIVATSGLSTATAGWGLQYSVTTATGAYGVTADSMPQNLSNYPNGYTMSLTGLSEREYTLWPAWLSQNSTLNYEYQITFGSLEPTTVPSPNSMFLIISGLISLCFLIRKEQPNKIEL